MASLAERLATHVQIGLDTAIFIYHFEANERYLSFTRTILAGVQSGDWKAVTSVVTLMEITVHPWRLQHAEVAREYEALLVHFPHLYLIDITRDIARRAAQLRAGYNLRPTDALQVATSLDWGATAFVTNDLHYRRISPVIDVIILDDFLSEPSLLER